MDTCTTICVIFAAFERAILLTCNRYEHSSIRIKGLELAGLSFMVSYSMTFTFTMPFSEIHIMAVVIDAN